MIYVSTSCLNDIKDIAAVLAIFSRIGIKNIELGSNHEYVENIEGLLRGYSGNNFIVHNYFPPTRNPFIMNLAARDEVIREKSLQVCRNAIDLCNHLGYKLYSFHPGFRVEETLDSDFELSSNVIPYDEAFSTFIRSVEEIYGYAKSCGVDIALENLEYKHDAYMMTQPHEFKRLLDIFPDIGVLMDIGHLNIASRKMGFEVSDFIECVGDNVKGIHIHENDGRSDQHLEPLNGGVVKYLEGVIDRDIILECRNSTSERVLKNIEFLQTYF